MPRLSIFERSVILATLAGMVCFWLSCTKVQTKHDSAAFPTTTWGGGQAPSATATSDPRKDEPARSANETSFNFIVDYSKGSLNAGEVLPEQAQCPSCMKLPDNLWLSGYGVLWEFYHFVIDFAPVLLEHVSKRGRPPQCTVLYGNGQRMSMESPEEWLIHNPGKNYHIREKWEFFFGTPFNLKYEYIGSFNKGSEPLPAKCPEVLGEWANGPEWEWGWANGAAKRFVDFRTHAHQLAGVSSAPPAGVILIKRGTLGQQRRNLDDTFYDAAAKSLDNRGIKYQVIDMEVMSMQDQVTKFANARVVVGQHGAGLSNINWMKDGTTVIELGIRNFLCYENLARAIKLNYVTFIATEWTSDVDNAIKQGALQLATLVWSLTDSAQVQLAGHAWKCPSMASKCDFNLAA